jgi:hypothetical protein
MKITFGSDPEFFVVNPKGEFKSAIGIIPGTKEARYDLGNGHKAYYDNVLAECEIKPANSAKTAISNFGDCFQRYAKLIKPYKLLPQASTIFPASECKHKDAFVFGCDPEFDAYDVKVCEPPECKKGNTFRSGGGHIHIGFEGGASSIGDSSEKQFESHWNRLWTIRMCDLFIGIPSLLMDHDPTSKERRKLYGGAGTHRICEKYGVEYRSLSNFWFTTPTLVNLIYDLSSFVVDLSVSKKVAGKIWDEIKPNKLRNTINKADTKQANEFLTYSKKFFSKDLLDRINDRISDKEKKDFYKEWKISN